MQSIVPIIGNVTYPITLDPSVWIFDDRKIEKNAFLNGDVTESEYGILEQVKESQMGLREGAVRPPVNKSIKRFEREKILSESYLIPLKPFLTTSEPKQDATKIRFEDNEGHGTEINLEDAMEGLFCFAEEGKPLKSDGPVHFYYRDASNKDQPVKNINKVVVI